MAAALVWTEYRDSLLRDLRGEGRSWDAIAGALGVSRCATIERGRLVGARKPPPDPASRSATAAALGAREPLPPGHPISWAAITIGTLLAGLAYPYPPVAAAERNPADSIIELAA